MSNIILGAFASDFAAADSDLASGRLGGYRVYDPWLPAVGAETWRSVPANKRPFWSLKAPNVGGNRDWQGAANGLYDSQYAALFAAVRPDALVAVAHEFETKMSTQLFHDMTAHLLEVFRQNAPAGALYGIVSDHFQYAPGNSGYANYQSDAECAITASLFSNTDETKNPDFAAIDVYSSAARGMYHLGNEPGYLRWRQRVAANAPRTGVAERGITLDSGSGTRADLIIQDIQTVTDHGMSFYFWWQASTADGSTAITNSATTGNDATGKRVMRAWAAGGQ